MNAEDVALSSRIVASVDEVSLATPDAAAATPMLSVRPAVSSIDMNASLPVAVSVTGSIAASGTVTLSGGGYNSGVQTLDSFGNYTFYIPANSLSVGTDTLTVSYSGDAVFEQCAGVRGARGKRSHSGVKAAGQHRR